MNKAIHFLFTKIQCTTILTSILFFLTGHAGLAQLAVIKASCEKAIIEDGEQVKLDWKLDPQSDPDTYYVNIPSKNGIVTFKTDQDQLTIHTQPGRTYEFMVLLNGGDSCHIAIASILPPTLPVLRQAATMPVHLPFKMIGSRIFLAGYVKQKPVSIQFDLGAGTSVVNRNVSQKLGLNFSSSTVVSNTDGVNRERTSLNNGLQIGALNWSGVPLTEVGNMKPFEDIIIGNGFFRNCIIEIDYDKQELLVRQKLPADSKSYVKLPVFYEQNRPKFKAAFIHNGKKFDFWFLFDTGRDGAMLLGEDFTAKDDHWNELQALTMVSGRKIIRLDAVIAGIPFKDIVTNAADPHHPSGRPSLFGNQILNHFNVIVDNKCGSIYLKPNCHRNDPYFNYDRYLQEMAQRENNK